MRLDRNERKKIKRAFRGPRIFNRKIKNSYDRDFVPGKTDGTIRSWFGLVWFSVEKVFPVTDVVKKHASSTMFQNLKSDHRKLAC